MVSTCSSFSSLEAVNKAEHGSEITIYLREDEEEAYDDYLEEWKIKELIKKYSDYVRYPIVMEVTKDIASEENEEQVETITELETLNSMTPIWKKNKSELEEALKKYKTELKNFIENELGIQFEQKPKRIIE